jgi:hypothetical protein
MRLVWGDEIERSAEGIFSSPFARGWACQWRMLKGLEKDADDSAFGSARSLKTY